MGKSVGIAAGVPAGAWAGGNGAIGEDGFFAAFEENAVWGDLDLVALEAREATSYDILRKGMVASLTSYRSSGDAQSLACSRAGFDP